VRSDARNPAESEDCRARKRSNTLQHRIEGGGSQSGMLASLEQRCQAALQLSTPQRFRALELETHCGKGAGLRSRCEGDQSRAGFLGGAPEISERNYLHQTSLEQWNAVHRFAPFAR
jgi:hypothetical protein